MLVPGLNYMFDTFIDCQNDKGVSDNIKVRTQGSRLARSTTLGMETVGLKSVGFRKYGHLAQEQSRTMY